MTERKLGVFGIAFLYAGAIMGAGFASGREIWQFFGVFGKYGFAGLAFVGALFIFVGIMTAIIARTLKTNDLGRIIVPGNSRILKAFTGYFMSFMLFTVVITMTAAGGALFMQQFGASRILGGALIVILVIATVLGGFKRVAKVFGYVIPLLIIVMVIVCGGVILKGIPESGIESQMIPSPLASVWQLAAVLYLSYNILAVVPIVANASINAKSTDHAVLGAALGGSFLAVLALMITLALQTDAGFSESMDMPMLAFAMELSPVTGVIYTGVMLFAIYSSATGNYYGFTTRLKNDGKKNRKTVIIAMAGFLLGLMGFRNVVAYMLPLEGFAGIAIIIMLTCNFFIVMKNKKKEEKTYMFRDFHDHNRFDFPDGLVRVTAGFGGESILFFGSEKTALFDCGMAYCGEELVQNIKEAIKRQEKKDGSARTLDYVMLSHTHYDHAGGIPYLRRCWPELIVFGAAHGKAVFERPGAIKTIRTLGIAAEKYYGQGDPQKIIIEGLYIDKVIEEGDNISLGKEYITVLETKGHTD
nr:MBL fold metallo-hydrolase [Bacillota bacterium]